MKSAVAQGASRAKPPENTPRKFCMMLVRIPGVSGIACAEAAIGARSAMTMSSCATLGRHRAAIA